MFPYCSILKSKIYSIYQLPSVGHGRYPALTCCLTFSLLQPREAVAILGGVSALISGICFSFSYKDFAVPHHLLVTQLSCNSTPSPTGGIPVHSSRWHTKYFHCLVTEAAVPPSLSASWCVPSRCGCRCHKKYVLISWIHSSCLYASKTSKTHNCRCNNKTACWEESYSL